MKKEVNILYALEQDDNTKTALFVCDGKPTKGILRAALVSYDNDFEDGDKAGVLGIVIDELYEKDESYYDGTSYFIDSVTLYSYNIPPYNVGDTVRWWCDDEQKVKTSKITKIEAEFNRNGAEFKYWTKTKRKGCMADATFTMNEIALAKIMH